MPVYIGIDIGGSATKIVGFRDDAQNRLPNEVFIKASDPLASLYGAFGKFTDVNDLQLSDIQQIIITGVGSTYVQKPIYGIPTGKADEFACVGLGGLYLSGLAHIVTVSMGTGTAFVAAREGDIYHIGGSGVGGGTVLGLSDRLFGVRNMDHIAALAEKGNLDKVDLAIKDILTGQHALPDFATASNFGKLGEMAGTEDIALGLLNMVFQTIGVMSVLAAKNAGCKHVVLTGKLSTVPQAADIFKAMAELYGIHFIIPGKSEFATACGAALTAVKQLGYTEIKGC